MYKTTVLVAIYTMCFGKAVCFIKEREKEMVARALALGAANAAVVDTADVVFRTEYRDACARNGCGKYGKCWMCPPDVGPIEEMILRAQSYRKMFVFQTIRKLEDSFDFEGMQAAGKAHNELTGRLTRALTPFLERSLVLGAGACQVCSRCTKEDNAPCRFPERAISSLEAYGIAVSELAEQCGMKYINGSNTVTYFSAFLFDPM